MASMYRELSVFHPMLQDSSGLVRDCGKSKCKKRSLGERFFN
jgi:hypothetical protein